METMSAGDIDAIVKSVTAKLAEGQSSTPRGQSSPSGAQGPNAAIEPQKNLIVVAGTFATDDSIRAARAYTATIVFDPLNRAFPSASRVVVIATDAIATGANSLSLTGLSLFELEALSDPKQGNPIAELVVEALGRGWRVSLSKDAHGQSDKAARLSFLRGALASRRDAALAALAAMGIETAPCEASAEHTAGPAKNAVRLIDSALVSSTAPGATINARFGAIITPLARDEARERGIRIERNGSAI